MLFYFTYILCIVLPSVWFTLSNIKFDCELLDAIGHVVISYQLFTIYLKWVHIGAADKLPFLDMNMIWYYKGDIWFEVFQKKGQQLKYSGRKRNHTPGTLYTIPLGLINWLGKTTSCSPEKNSKRVYSIYPNHTNSIYDTGTEHSIFTKMGKLWRDLDLKKMVRNTNNDLNTEK